MVCQRASATLLRAEGEIRELISEAAAGGDYRLVDHLSNLGRRLAVLAAEVRGETAATPSSEASQMDAPELKERKAAVRAGTRMKLEYPKFRKSRDVLVKIGWSKRERSEYQHRAPKSSVDAVARRIEHLGASGRLFTAEELLLGIGASGGQDIPSYQAYICLAWLRHIGAVEQHGREGYTVRAGADVLTIADQGWSALPAVRN